MAAAAAGTLTLTALHPGLAASAAIFAVAGALGTYQVTVGTTFASSVPPACRAQALGIAAAGLVAGPGTRLRRRQAGPPRQSPRRRSPPPRAPSEPSSPAASHPHGTDCARNPPNRPD